jgi:hypothetical protein
MCESETWHACCPQLLDVIMNMGRQALARTCCRRSPHATDMVLVKPQYLNVVHSELRLLLGNI